MFLFLLVDTECSGRSLATLLVAWVGAAMIASILLRCKYMWIVLALLTLLFLLVCGYTAYNAKRTHERSVVVRPESDTMWFESSERTVVVGNEISTVSGIMSDCEPNEPPRYRSNWQPAGDLPPSYASVIGETSSPSYSILSLSQPPTTMITHTATSAKVISPPSDEISSPCPPPYSIVVSEQSQSNSTTLSIDENVELATMRHSADALPNSSFLTKDR